MVLRFVVAQVGADFVPAKLSEKGRAVLSPFPLRDEHESLVEVDVLHPELATLRHAQSSAVDEPGHDLRAVRMAPNSVIVSGMLRTTGRRCRVCSWREREPIGGEPQHLAAQEQDGAHRLILRARRDAPVHCQMRQVVAVRFSVNSEAVVLLLADEVIEEVV